MVNSAVGRTWIEESLRITYVACTWRELPLSILDFNRQALRSNFTPLRWDFSALRNSYFWARSFPNFSLLRCKFPEHLHCMLFGWKKKLLQRELGLWSAVHDMTAVEWWLNMDRGFPFAFKLVKLGMDCHLSCITKAGNVEIRVLQSPAHVLKINSTLERVIFIFLLK